MANDEHKRLAQYLKDVHLSLRKTAATDGVDKAWHDHCSNKDTLNTYANFMEKLATTHWEKNASDEITSAVSRIKWTADFAYEYFLNESLIKHTEREIDIGNKANIEIVNEIKPFDRPFQLLDVGSCYNPFKVYNFLDVLAIDLCPANNSVYECDFLLVPIKTETVIVDNKVNQLKKNSFDIVTFCFLLEYMPSSQQRIKVCENAYRILKSGGLLVITTPDSKHVGANSKVMKCWRYTLATMGFSRIKYEKFKHMHCMAFRKTLSKDIAVRWATLYKEPYMEYCIQIPQDFNLENKKCLLSQQKNIMIDSEDFKELPFYTI